MQESQIDEKQRDELQELGNIGAGRASRYLSDLVDEKINISVPQVDIVSLSPGSEEVSDIMDLPSNQQLMAVLMPTEHPAGGVVFIFTQEDYQKFLKLISQNNEESQDFLETSEKVSNFYLDAIESFLSLDVDTSDARLISLPLNTLLIQISSSVVEDSSESNALIINTEFSIPDDENETKGEITFFLEINDMDQIIETMEEKL